VGVLGSGQPVEIATIGREGFVGMPLLLGADRTRTAAFWQVPGSALRMNAGDFMQHVRRSDDLRDLLHRYTLAMFTLVAQASACNRAHSMIERCARWLLLTRDRVS
jgi:hypothetical protein